MSLLICQNSSMDVKLAFRCATDLLLLERAHRFVQNICKDIA